MFFGNEEVRQELAKAEVEKQKAEAALKEFNEGEDGRWLAELKEGRRDRGTAYGVEGGEGPAGEEAREVGV